MFSLGGGELFILAVVALMLFGPDKIPQLARTIGRFTREFNKYKDIMESTVRQEIYKADTEETAVPAEPELTTEQRIVKAAAAANELRAQKAAEAAAAEAKAAEAEAAAARVVPATDEGDEEDEE